MPNILVWNTTQIDQTDRNLLEKLVVAELVNKFHIFYGTRRLTTAHHWMTDPLYTRTPDFLKLRPNGVLSLPKPNESDGRVEFHEVTRFITVTV